MHPLNNWFISVFITVVSPPSCCNPHLSLIDSVATMFQALWKRLRVCGWTRQEWFIDILWETWIETSHFRCDTGTSEHACVYSPRSGSLGLSHLICLCSTSLIDCTFLLSCNVLFIFGNCLNSFGKETEYKWTVFILRVSSAILANAFCYLSEMPHSRTLSRHVTGGVYSTRGGTCGTLQARF